MVQTGYPPAYLSSFPSTVSLAIHEGLQKQERGLGEGNAEGGMEDVGGTFITPLRMGKSSWEEMRKQPWTQMPSPKCVT